MQDRYTGTILKDTNVLVTSSGVEFSFLREDSYIIVEGQNNFYKVIGKDKRLYVKKAIVTKDNEITIDGEERYKFCLNDLITFTHKQYSLTSVSVDPERRGSGYKVDDAFHLKFTEGITSSSGVLAINSYDGSEATPYITVSEVDESGGILSLEMVSGGKYNILPDLKMDFDSGLSLNLEAETLNERIMEDRVIKALANEGHVTILTLDHPLPQNLKLGKVSVNKWELSLNVPYAGEDALNCSYRICKDFTPNYNLPLMHVGALTNESAYNESLSLMDSKLKELENRLDALN